MYGIRSAAVGQQNVRTTFCENQSVGSKVDDLILSLSFSIRKVG